MTRSKVIKCKMIKFQRQYQQEELPSLGEICFRGNFVTVIYLFIYLFILCLLLTVLQLNIYTHKKKTSSSQGKTTCDAN